MAARRTHAKCHILVSAAVATIMLFVMLINTNQHYQPTVYKTQAIDLREEKTATKSVKNWRCLTEVEINKLSVLGRILYLDEQPPKTENPQKKYQILVWKYGRTIEARHLKHFGTEQINPFEDCSVNNCEITYADDSLKSADLVLFHLHRMKNEELPMREGSYNQIWAFLTDESPYHTFLSKNTLSNYNRAFNWSMTYRMDSDIPVPYGRTVSRKTQLTESFTTTKRRDVLVAILGSNCGGKNKRWDYVRELQKHISVDVYGGCGPLKTCPGHFRSDCHDIDNYLFYLSFENSNCEEYITEKVWWNAYQKNSIPIVMGASKESYKKFLPPGSYLNVDEYATPKDLAAQIIYLNETGNYHDYFKWRSYYEVLNEHGYFRSKSYHYCRVCEALNYNERTTKIYENLTTFWNTNEDCHPAWNVKE